MLGLWPQTPISTSQASRSPSASNTTRLPYVSGSSQEFSDHKASRPKPVRKQLALPEVVEVALVADHKVVDAEHTVRGRPLRNRSLTHPRTRLLQVAEHEEALGPVEQEPRLRYHVEFAGTRGRVPALLVLFGGRRL